MIFTHETNNEPEQILHLGKYFKYWLYANEGKTRNPNFDDFSGAILNLKNEEEYAITYFLNRLKEMLGDNFVVCYVPSHDPEKTRSGIRTLAQRVANAKTSIVDGTGCLVRTQKIPKLASGGSRSIDVHLRSLKVENPELIQGKDVLILDDVTTTHGSLLACKQILQQAGAKFVQCVALGQTQLE
jgi:predicted amidophosphoribosyltransferase